MANRNVKVKFSAAKLSSGKGNIKIAKDSSYRVHGSGNYVVISEYKKGDNSPIKHPANEEMLQGVINSDKPIWIDAERMSKVQLGGVIDSIAKVKGPVHFKTVRRSGRSMIVAEKNKVNG